jgi:transcriptional regulator with XRE-family HTH domain
MTFGLRLRGLRVDGGLTQEELAERSGVSVRAIRDLELGRTGRPHRRSAALLADALRLDAAARAGLLMSAGPVREAPPVGREALFGAVHHYLSSGGECAVLSGGPGSGKTTCLRYLADRLAPHFPDGRVWLDLDEPARLVPPPTRRRVLVVLDNVTDPAQLPPAGHPGAVLAATRFQLDTPGLSLRLTASRREPAAVLRAPGSVGGRE